MHAPLPDGDADRHPEIGRFHRAVLRRADGLHLHPLPCRDRSGRLLHRARGSARRACGKGHSVGSHHRHRHPGGREVRASHGKGRGAQLSCHTAKSGCVPHYERRHRRRERGRDLRRDPPAAQRSVHGLYPRRAQQRSQADARGEIRRKRARPHRHVYEKGERVHECRRRDDLQARRTYKHRGGGGAGSARAASRIYRVRSAEHRVLLLPRSFGARGKRRRRRGKSRRARAR